MANSWKPTGREVSNLELLRIQAGMSLDERGRIAGHWGLIIAAAPEGQLLFLGSELPGQLADDLQATFDSARHDADPTSPPPALADCELLLHQIGGPTRRTPGPCYLIPPGTQFGSSAQLTLSSDRQVEILRPANPGNWFADEWDELLDGKLGPWAMATIGGRVISICHTPTRMTDDAAEGGVWTDRDFRGKGHAAAVTAAWATILEPTGRHLFYSTDAENHSSQGVAARLGLRPIGWKWSLAQPRVETGPRRHPLSNPAPQP
jgi:hypothetical protein